ncbi:MAG: N-acetyltransferase family protein [Rhodoluna sp.]
MSEIIRPITADDRTGWDELWAGYLEFYKTNLSSEQTELTWSRLLDDEHGIHGLVADIDGELLGFAHFSFTHSTWAENQDLYLEDLFVSKTARGQGIGKALILSLDAIALEEGSSKVWWETQNHNVKARKLYDSVAELSEFVKYVRAVN